MRPAAEPTTPTRAPSTGLRSSVSLRPGRIGGAAVLMAAIGLGGCETTTQSTYITPFDGQTDWPVEQPLEVALAREELPPDYPVDPDLLRVVDLTDGGLVEGDVVLDGRFLRFYPAEGWSPATDYAWTLSAPLVRNREPQLLVPPVLRGDARFSTAGHLEVVSAVTEEGRTCLQLSRAFDDDTLRIYVDGERGLDWSIVEVTVGGVEDAQTATLHALCTAADGVGSIRVEVGASEVYQFSPGPGSALSAFRDLHRVVAP